VLKDFTKDLVGVAVGVDGDDFVISVEFEDGAGFFFVDGEAFLDDFVTGVVDAVFFEGAAAHAFDEFLAVGAGEVEDFADIEVVLQELGLVEIAREAVEDEVVDFRFEAAEGGHVVDVMLPEVQDDFIGDELATAGVFHEGFAYFGAEVDGAEDFTAGDVEEAGDGSEDAALCAFAGTGGSDEEVAAIFHLNIIACFVV
jgi:hypothetical protein